MTPGCFIAQGTLLLARGISFRDGLEVGRRALEVAPRNEAAYGLVVDASNELGALREAARGDAQEMVDVRPNLSSRAACRTRAVSCTASPTARSPRMRQCGDWSSAGAARSGVRPGAAAGNAPVDPR